MDYETVHDDNYLFINQTSESREKHRGMGDLTIILTW